ncbi:hypothetical protein LF887_00585 [Chryseobacterium sp. MEBOG06]|uniref:hypothetical protein n=1 Tax=Chryseobacterium sp. MEBOG06 TaxID=2879938 RepID=UPI001F1F725E|nr:hypothetical protein [Chryseobacterium sp. MEBOG06]UKB84179.1 hypothetical protein LF887_00585 [Chryseobacterium sp. MEBOG06]
MNNSENKAAGSSADNTPSQTLFRFVNLRSPQLPDEKKEYKKFIRIPDSLKNDDSFYKPVVANSGSKQRVLKERAEIYKQNSSFIPDAKTLKQLYAVVYDYALWLAKNKDNCTQNQLNEKIRQVTISSSYAFPNLVNLWNNLIYQIVTQKDFYVKEGLMQILLAAHTLQPDQVTYNEEDVRDLLSARVLIPRELMLDTPNTNPIGIASKMAEKELGEETAPSAYMEKQQKIQEAQALLSRYNALTKELSLIETQYKKEYEKQYKSEEKEYNNANQNIIDDYYARVEEARRKFCEIRKPDQPYNPADPCQRPEEIPYPKLDKFDFSFRSEIEGKTLANTLKPDSVDTMLSLLEYDFSGRDKGRIDNSGMIDSLLAGRNTFNEVKDLISNASEKANRIILDNMMDNSETYTSIGGVLLPVSRVETIPFTYQLCPKFIMRFTSLDLSIDVPDASWNVASMSYTFYTNAGPISGTYFEKSRVGNKIFLSKLLASPTTDGVYITQTENFTMDVKITFTNGKVTAFQPRIITMKSCYSSSFELVNEVKDPVEQQPDDSYIPSGFGFKQIGIADYLKVEQTTHAYVEGEVAHIENVMAREYREKATRRLRRSENTSTTSSDTEREKLTDTTTATRFEMQSEIAKMLQESRDTNVQAHFDAKWEMTGGASFSTGVAGGYANHSSKEESTRQAVTQAQDITARALDRVVTKVHEERIEKIIEEFEENNKHGFDNTKGDKHVVGVFRWVDKLMKNQIYNYGKRLMFEFMIPQPAKLHTLGMTLDNSATKSDLVKPEDPRKASTLTMENYASLNNDATLKHWVSKYNAEIDERPADAFAISKSFSGRDGNFGGKDDDKVQIVNGNGEVEVPEGYLLKTVDYTFQTYPHGFKGAHQAFMTIGGQGTNWITSPNSTQISGATTTLNIKNKLEFSFATGESPIMQGTLKLNLELTTEARNAWLQKTFKAIIDSYEKALAIYEQKIAEEKATGIQIKGTNPGFYRQIENTVLRKNCISYMINRAANSTHGYGMAGLTTGSTFTDYETDLSSTLDKYTAFLKFMEQAFEWENLSYYLYPYYWANKTEWANLYQAEDVDPLFRAFLQSGMARVVATVRPGFEDAVQFYMATGKIWNGGEVPVIGDSLYMSIVDEMKQPKGVKQGKAWITRLPTPLNILQAESIGLKVGHALPFTAEDPNEFEVPGDVITESNFVKDNSLMGTKSSTKQIQFSLKQLDSTASYKTVGDLDDAGEFPRKYECMGQTIEVVRDAKWSKTDSLVKLYGDLAGGLSRIEGIEAFANPENGVTIRVDIDKIKNFKFVKPPYSEMSDTLSFTTDGINYLKFADDFFTGSSNRLFDKDDKLIDFQEYHEKLPLSRFLI